MYDFQLLSFQSHTKHLLDLIKSTKEEAEEMAEKLKQRATLHAKLVDEFEKNNRNLNRFAIAIALVEFRTQTVFAPFSSTFLICFCFLFFGVETRTHHEF